MTSSWGWRLRWKLRALLIILSAGATSAGAQEVDVTLEKVIAQWSTEAGIIVTPAAAEAALKDVATKISTNALKAGVDPVQVAKFATVIEQGGYVSTVPGGIVGEGDAGKADLRLGGSHLYAEIVSTLQPKYVFMQLYQYPTLTVLVEPVPPVDFVIEINGWRPREAKPDGTYAFEPGEIDLLVTRNNRPDCTWKGRLEAGQKFSVSCKM